VETHPLQAARPEVFDEDVARLEEATEDLATRVGAKIEPDRALVAIHREGVGRRPRRGVVTDPWRAPAARGVAVGRLDLDDIRAEVAEEHRRVRSGEHRRAIDHADPRE